MLKDYSRLSDQELWNSIRLNDQEAFHVLYLRHWKPLLLVAHNLLNDKDACMDIVQDIFVALWVKRHTTFIVSLKSYLRKAVRNSVFKQLRKGYLSQKHMQELQIVSFVDATEQMINYNQLNEIYNRTVNSLPQKCKEVFLLSRNEGLSVKVISQKLGIAPKTVENHISKALKLLRKAISEAMFLLAFFSSIW